MAAKAEYDSMQGGACMDIIRLTEQDDPRIGPVCDAMLSWWGTREGYSREKMLTYLKHLACGGPGLPQFYILVEQERTVGAFQLSMSDIDVRPDLYPWLTNVYVEADSRGRGYLNGIMQTVKAVMERLGLPRIYLYTYHNGLYERYGFRLITEFQTFITPDDIQRLYVLERPIDPREASEEKARWL